MDAHVGDFVVGESKLLQFFDSLLKVLDLLEILFLNSVSARLEFHHALTNEELLLIR